MAEVYAALGQDIVLGAIVKASDINDIQSSLVRELARRKMSNVSTQVGTNAYAFKNDIQKIDTDCRSIDYKNEETFDNITTEQLQRYVEFIKTLYSKILVS